MRKLVIALWLAAISFVYAGGSANGRRYYAVYKAPPAAVAEPPPPGPTRYYSDYGLFYGGWLYGSSGGYGPFADCNGSRCYIGPPPADGPLQPASLWPILLWPAGGYYRDGWYN